MKSRAPQLHLEYRFYKQLGHAGRIGFCVRWLENGRFTFCQRSLFDSSKNCQLPIWFSNMGHAKYGCQADSAVEPTCAPTMWRSATVCQALAVHGGGVPTPLCWRQQLRYFDRQHRRPAKSTYSLMKLCLFTSLPCTDAAYVAVAHHTLTVVGGGMTAAHRLAV